MARVEEGGWGFVDRREALGDFGGAGSFKIQYSRKSIASNHSSRLCEAKSHYFFPVIKLCRLYLHPTVS